MSHPPSAFHGGGEGKAGDAIRPVSLSTFLFYIFFFFLRVCFFPEILLFSSTWVVYHIRVGDSIFLILDNRLRTETLQTISFCPLLL